MDTPSEGEAVSFERQVKPLFRSRDRDAMLSHFDLWSYEDVSTHAGAIGAQLRAGTMPCDGAWPPEQIQVFQRWVETEMPA